MSNVGMSAEQGRSSRSVHTFTAFAQQGQRERTEFDPLRLFVAGALRGCCLAERL